MLNDFRINSRHTKIVQDLSPAVPAKRTHQCAHRIRSMGALIFSGFSRSKLPDS